MKFKQEIVLVTGSTRGIGKGIAEAFAKEGAKVIINGVSEDRVKNTVLEFRASGYDAYGAVFDVSNFNGTCKEIDRIKNDIGAITILVNNAGISPKKNNRKVLFKDMEYEEWSKVVDVNLNGVFNCSRAVINDMIHANRGKIINISSAFARYYSPISSSHYVTTKTAVLGITRAISGETCMHGINCNAIAPGRAWTEMTIKQPKEVNDAFMETIPVGEFAKVEDIAAVALFLASEEASYIHGATVDVNGGICMI